MTRLIILTLLFLTGCAHEKIVYGHCPKPQVLQRPVYPVKQLKKGDTPPVVVKAYVSSFKGCEGYTNELERILKAYK